MSRPLQLLKKLACSALLILTFQAFINAQQISSASLPALELWSGLELNEPSPLRPSARLIIANFIKTETLIRNELNQYTFKRDVVLQTIGPNGQVTGEYIRKSQVLFDDKGNRIERVTYRPPSTIREMRITKEDIQDLAGAQLLGLDIVDTFKYRISFVAHDKLANKSVYVLNVEPAVRPNPNKMSDRFFCGRIWIDTETFQILRVRGIVEPSGKQRFPTFETWRDCVNGRFCLPSHTVADDILHFPKRDVHYRIGVTYYDYKLFASKLKITEIDASN